MKTTTKITQEHFDAVGFMRKQRDKLTKKLSKMTKEEIIAYFKQRKREASVKPSS